MSPVCVVAVVAVAKYSMSIRHALVLISTKLKAELIPSSTIGMLATGIGQRASMCATKTSDTPVFAPLVAQFVIFRTPVSPAFKGMNQLGVVNGIVSAAEDTRAAIAGAASAVLPS